MIDFDGDLDEMLSEDDFGVEFDHNGVTGITGIFSDLYFENEVGIAGLEGSQPILYVKEAVNINYDEVVTLEAKQYKVINIHPDRTGMKMVMLHAL